MRNLTKVSAGIAAVVAGSAVQAAEQTIELNAGWNLIAANTAATDSGQSIQELFGPTGANAERVMMQSADGSWVARDVKNDRGNLTDLPRNKGIWIKMPDGAAPTTVTVGGTSTLGRALQLGDSDNYNDETGWKLIGAGNNVTSVSELIASITNTGAGLEARRLFAWNKTLNSGAGGWDYYDTSFSADANTLSTLDQSKGLWAYFSKVLAQETSQTNSAGDGFQVLAANVDQLGTEYEIKVYTDSAATVSVTGDAAAGADQQIDNSTTIELKFTDTRLEQEITKTITVSEIGVGEKYEVDIFDRFGNRVAATQIVTHSTAGNSLDVLAASAGCELVNGACASVTPTIFAYGLPVGSGAPVLLQEVEIYRVHDGSAGSGGLDSEGAAISDSSDGALATNPIGTLLDPVTGLNLGEIPTSAKIALVKEGYITVYKNVGDSGSIYGVMQEVTHNNDSLSSNAELPTDETADDPGLGRQLHASPAAAAPSAARNNAGAALMLGVGRGNPNSSIGIQVTPYATPDAIVDLHSQLEDAEGTAITLANDPSLEAAVQRAFLDHPNVTMEDSTGTTITGQSDISAAWGRNFAAYSFKVVGGASLRVYDRNTGEDYSDERRAASHADMGAWADIRPYISSTLDGTMEEHLALAAEFASASTTDSYRVLNRAFMRTPAGWRMMPGEVKYINPADSDGNATPTVTSMEASTSAALDLDEVTWGYSAVENRTVKHKMPLDQLVMTTSGDDNGLLMDKIDSIDASGGTTATDGGGLYDYAFVSIQVLPVVRDIVTTVLESSTGVPLPFSLVTLNGGSNAMTDGNGVASFRDVAMPITSPTIEISALRNDHYRNSVTLEVGEIIANSTEVTETAEGATESMVRNQYAATVRIQEVALTAKVTGNVTDSADGTPVAEAAISLISPAALSQLRADMEAGEFIAFQDPQARYTWEIRVHYDENQASRSGALARTAERGLHRILVNADAPETWQSLKSSMGRDDGHRLSFDDVVRKIANVEEGQSADDDYSLVGTYDVRVTVDYEIDQSHQPGEEGFGDYQEVSGAGMTISVDINPELLAATEENDVSYRPLNWRVLPYPIADGQEEAEISQSGDYADYEMRGSREHGYFYVLNKTADAQNLAPRVYWEVDVQWSSSDGESLKWLEPVVDGNGNVTSYQWVAAAEGFELATARRHRTLALSPEPVLGQLTNEDDSLRYHQATDATTGALVYQQDDAGSPVLDDNGDPIPVYDETKPLYDESWNMPMLPWTHVVASLSDPELFKAFLQPIDSSDQNGARYIDTYASDGAAENNGFNIRIKGVVYGDEASLDTPSDKNGDDDSTDRNVPFVLQSDMNLKAPFSQNRQSVLKITDATAVPLEGLVERNTATGPMGYFTFNSIPAELGAFTNLDLNSSYLRVSAYKDLYYRAELAPTPKFSRDNATTAILEDVSNKHIDLDKIPTRNVVVTTAANATVYLGESGRFEVANESGAANFADVPVGGYTLRAEPGAGDSEHGMSSAQAQITQFTADSDTDVEVAQSVTLTLPGVTWISDSVPVIDVTISDMMAGGFVVVEGEVKEYKALTDAADSETALVPYGMSGGDRVRDLLSIRVNDRILPLQMDGESRFSTTVQLREGLNGIILSAVNEVGRASTPTQMVNFFPSFGSVSGTVTYDHDNDDQNNDGFKDNATEVAASAQVPAAGALLTVTQGENQRSVVTEDDGDFSLFGLPAGESIDIHAIIQSESGRFALDSGSVSAVVPEGIQYKIAEPLQLTSIFSAAEGQPVVAVDDSLVKDGMFYLDARVGNYDGQGIGTTEPRPIQVTINGETFDVAVSGDRNTETNVNAVRTATRQLNAGEVVDETENLMWHVNTQSVRLTRRHNEIVVSATNLNGEHNIAPPIYVENDAVIELDVTMNVTMPGLNPVATDQLEGGITLYNIDGEPVAARRFVEAASSTDVSVTQNFHTMEAGLYTYLIEVPGYIPQRGMFVLNENNAATDGESGANVGGVNEQVVSASLEAATLDISWFELEGLTATRLQAQERTGDQLTVAGVRQVDANALPGEAEDALVYMDDTGRLTLVETDNEPYLQSEPLVIDGEAVHTNLAQVSGNLRLVIPTHEFTTTGNPPFSGLMQVVTGDQVVSVQMPTQLPAALAADSSDAGADGVAAGTAEYLIPFSAVVNVVEGHNVIDVLATASDGELRENAGTIFVEPASTPVGAMTVTLDWASGYDMDLHSFYFPDWGMDDTTPAEAGMETGSQNYGHVYYSNTSYRSDRIQDIDWIGEGWEGSGFQPEHHTWATATVDGRGVVADGTYLVVANDYSDDDADRVTVTLTAPGIGDVTYGPYDSSEAADSGKQPVFVVHVENNRVVEVETVPVGSSFGAAVTDIIGGSNLFGPDEHGMYRTRTLAKPKR